MNLQQIVKDRIGEPQSDNLQYALMLPANTLGKIICAFANTNGGLVILGVQNKNGKVTPVGISADFNVKGVLNNTFKNIIPGNLKIDHGYIVHDNLRFYALQIEKSSHEVTYNAESYIFRDSNPVKAAIASNNYGNVTKNMTTDEKLNIVLQFLCDNKELNNVNLNTVKTTIFQDTVSLDEAEMLIDNLRDSDLVRSIGTRFISYKTGIEGFLQKGGYTLKSDQSDSDNSLSVFISYNWGTKANAKRLHEILVDNGIKVTRDDYDLSYKDRLSTFMESIRGHDFAVLLISDAYLKSAACMTEVLHLLKERSYMTKILPVLDDNVKIFNAEGRLAYLNYWKEYQTNLSKQLEDIAPEDVLEEYRQKRMARTISQDISEFLTMISDTLVSTLSKEEMGNYSNLISYIRKNVPAGKTFGKANTA